MCCAVHVFDLARRRRLWQTGNEDEEHFTGPLHSVRLFHFANIIILCAKMSVLHIHYAYFLCCVSFFFAQFYFRWLFRCPIAYGKYLISPFCFLASNFFFPHAFAAHVCAAAFSLLWMLAIKSHEDKFLFSKTKCRMWKLPWKKRNKTWMVNMCHKHTQTLWVQFSGIFFTFICSTATCFCNRSLCSCLQPVTTSFGAPLRIKMVFYTVENTM